MKKITFLLSLTILMMSMVVPISTTAATNEQEELYSYLDDGFDSYSNNDELLKSWIPHTSGLYDNALYTSNNNNMLKVAALAGNGKSTFLNKSFNTECLAGKLEISFSMMHDYKCGQEIDRNLTSLVYLYNNDYNGTTKNLALLKISGESHTMYVSDRYETDEYKVTNIESGVWYDVNIVYDTSNCGYEIKVTDRTNEFTKSGIYEGWNSILAGYPANAIQAQVWGEADSLDGHGAMYIDNIKVTQESAYINDNFDSYTDMTAVTTGGWSDVNGSGSVEINEIKDGNAIKLLPDGGIQGWNVEARMKLFNRKFENNKLKISASMMLEDNEGVGVSGYISLYGPDEKSSVSLVKISQGKTYMGDKNTNITAGDVSVGKWYDISIIYDYATATWSAEVMDENGTLVGKSADGKVSNSWQEFNPATSIVGFGFGAGAANEWGAAGKAAVYVDNVVIEDYVPGEYEVPEAPSALLEDNFNTYTDVSDMKKVWTPRDTNSDASAALGTGEDGSAAFKISRKNNLSESASDWVETKLNESVKEGKIKASFKFMSDYTDETGGQTAKMTTVISLVAGDVNSYIPVIYIQDGKIYTGVNNASNASKYLCDSDPNKWYDVELEFDTTKWVYDISVIDGSHVYKKESVNVKDFSGAKDMTNVGRFRAQLWGGKVGYGSSTIDDVLVDYSTDKIDVKTTDLSFEDAKGNKFYYAATIPASTAKINIDFGTMMNESSLTADTVVLTDVTDANNHKAVVYNGALSSSVYTLNLPTLLVPGKKYDLKITRGVKNYDNEPAAQEVIFNFASDSGYCEVSFNSIAIGENTSPAVADILVANSAKVKLNVINSTAIDKELLLIIGYYKNKELVDVIYNQYTMPYTDYVNGIFEQDVVLKTGVDADEISVFAWDAITKMKPYTGSMDIPAVKK